MPITTVKSEPSRAETPFGRSQSTVPAGTEVEYVYTRSSWESIERPASCPGDTPPRKFTVENAPRIERDDSVAKWRDLDC